MMTRALPIRAAALPPSDSSARSAALAEIGALERSCADLEAALQEHDWERLDAAIGAARRITHSLEKELEREDLDRDDAFDTLVRERLERIHAIRERQIVRLSAYHEELGERLKTFVKFKAYARSIGANTIPPRRAGLDSQQ